MFDLSEEQLSYIDSASPIDSGIVIKDGLITTVGKI